MDTSKIPFWIPQNSDVQEENLLHIPTPPVEYLKWLENKEREDKARKDGWDRGVDTFKM